jgi:hypothetical protein
VPDEDAALYRAVALRLINQPVDPALMAVAAKRKSNDDPLARPVTMVRVPSFTIFQTPGFDELVTGAA